MSLFQTKIKKVTVNYFIPFFVLVFLLFLLTRYIGYYYVIVSRSMEKAILPGDRVWIWKWGFGLERDGIYLFNNIQIDSSGNENLFLKRLVGLPGDTVLYVNDLIWINNTPHHTS